MRLPILHHNFMSGSTWVVLAVVLLSLTTYGLAKTASTDEGKAQTPATRQQNMRPDDSTSDDDELFDEHPPPMRMGPKNRAGQGGGPGMRRSEPMPELTAEQKENVYAILKEVNPAVYRSIQTWKETEPERFDRALRRVFGMMQNLVHLREHDPQMYELRVSDFRYNTHIRSLAREYRQSPDEALQSRLRQVLAELFEVRQKIRHLELERMKQKITELETQFKQRTENREALIDNDFKRMVEKRGQKRF
ncbi:MAG TPA: hypothetical protein DCM28_15505 [Phycisphaerales bacterium]|nr:hypothetical protein [Phycisphaerales bacterium]HCD33741.1 hypothetical protein [Phycisphaerales bacterium]|tara:strand:- start:157 stop:903 length:747 start_codon:yes stop_codon:yes gene_type:complete